MGTGEGQGEADGSFCCHEVGLDEQLGLGSSIHSKGTLYSPALYQALD